MEFTEEKMERYSRHILLKDVGVEGQIKIMESRVLIIGAGGLGAPAALYLAAAGVGTIGIVDFDRVDLSNLQRQVIHFTKDIGTEKVLSAAEKMQAINPDVSIKAIHEFVRAENILGILDGWDDRPGNGDPVPKQSEKPGVDHVGHGRSQRAESNTRGVRATHGTATTGTRSKD